MSEGALLIIVLVLSGFVIIDVLWSLLVKGDTKDVDAEERHQALMSEIRRHTRDR